MSDTRIENHFGEAKKPHTKIKHSIFEKLLKLSLSIANTLANSEIPNELIYTYVDLFSGPGIFSDKSSGSPIIAYDILENHINYSNNKFKNLQIIAIDKSEANIDCLNSLINTKCTENNISNSIVFSPYKGDWDTYKDNIKNHLNASKWGFIFADPFSTELDIKLLIQTLKNTCQYKDILIFFNYNTLVRQKGRNGITDIKRICKSLGASDKEISDNSKTFYEKFEDHIKARLNNIKTYVKGVSFPVSKKGNLIIGDYFYLVLATNSLILVDDFLESYEEALKTFSSYNSQLFVLSFTALQNEIMATIQKDFNKEVTLFKLYDHLTDRFLSWKNSIEQGDKVPTIHNVVNIINDLKKSGYIKINSSIPKYLYVKGEKIQGNIKSNMMSSTQALKAINISLGSNCYR